MKKLISTTTLLLISQICVLAQSKLPKSALDYMLRKPTVVKTFEHKTFGDHLYVQAGGGPTFTFGGNDNLLKINTPSVQANFMVGDWVTPEHGWRLGVSGGLYKNNSVKAKFAGLSMDYMMNISALASPQYTRPYTFELYGILGAEYQYSRSGGVTEHVKGARIGLQANVRAGNYLHFFLEPRIGLYSDNILHSTTWKKYRPAASFLAGVGYNLVTGSKRHSAEFPYEDFLNGLFVSGALGGGGLLRSEFSEMNKFKGARAQVSLGKWFDPYSAIRLTAKTEIFQRNGKRKMKGFGGQIDYMLNVNNLFGGYNPNRQVDIYGIAGVGLNNTGSGNGRQYSPSVGGGIQANVFLNRKHNFSFFIEPRIDINGGRYIDGYNTVSKFDATATVAAGLTFHRPPTNIKPRIANQKFPQLGAYRHWFVEGAGGMNSLIVSAAPRNLRSYLSPQMRFGVGRWLNATSGARLSFDFAKYKHPSIGTNDLFGIGMDYMWNITNAINGYLPNRSIEFVGTIGANLATHSDRKHHFFGVNVGGQILWNVNQMTSVYVEPQVRFYGDNFVPRTSSSFKLDMLGSVMTGIRLNFNGYNQLQSRKKFLEEDQRSFVYGAAGVRMKPYFGSSRNYYGLTGNIGFGRWNTPISAWRFSGSGSEWKEKNKRIIRVAAHADYMLDLTSLAYGYSSQRAINLRAFAGAGLGIDYHRAKVYLTPMLRIGGQMGVRLSNQLELFVEPQLSKQIVRTGEERFNKADGVILLGVNYKLKPSAKSDDRVLRDLSGDQFLSLAGGLGMNAETIVRNNPFHRKWSFDLDISYGRWLNVYSGMRVGVNNTFIQRHRVHNRSILGLYADYMLNLNSLYNGGVPTNSMMQYTAAVGVTGNIGLQQGHSPCFAPGLKGSLQADVNLSEHFSIFVEPTLNIVGKRILIRNGRPLEAFASLKIGTKLKF